ncbi:E3 ubiquitin-protein ligase [Desmophyllum pertusum]|uniref:E3 ubiquitin-protein ligase n=1 Tax=Desmophyllum pertusum TaxID=174260 RepID=A0A9X0CTV4_9CNID|nr:E3 ubiquitin-protein ligase [Desmophyllum pertusum]
MVKFSECFQEPTVASSPSMFCQLQIKPDLCLPDHEIMQYVDKDNSLRSSKLIFDFTDQLNEAILEKEIWEDISDLAPVSNCLTRANAAKIKLRWHGQVYRDLLINVDIVPALHFPNFWPPNGSKSALLNSQIKERGVHVVMAMHGESLKSTEKHFRLSFSLAETEIFQALPEQVRLSYILAKAVRSTYTCPEIVQRIETVQEQPSGSDDDVEDGDDDNDDDDNDDDGSGSEMMNMASQQRKPYPEELPSFFVPGANLLENNYNEEQHSDVFHGGLDFCPTDTDVHLTQDLYQESEDTMIDHLRKPFIKVLKGILQSHW